jgi:hypothetical protein
MKMSSFSAPWDTKVKLLTIFVSAILGYSVLNSIRHRTHFSESEFLFSLIVPLALLSWSGLMVTGYTVDQDGIVIHRLL